jgi:hypothetical protein
MQVVFDFFIGGERDNAAANGNIYSSKSIPRDTVWVDKSFNIEFKHCEEVAPSACFRHLFEFSIYKILMLELVSEVIRSREVSIRAINKFTGEIVLGLLFGVHLRDDLSFDAASSRFDSMDGIGDTKLSCIRDNNAWFESIKI